MFIGKYIIPIFTPLFWGSIFGFSFYFVLNHLKITIQLPRIDFILDAILDCAITLSGFVFTAITIIIGLGTSDFIKYIVGNHSYKELRMRSMYTLIFGIIFVLYIIILGTLVDAEGNMSKLLCATSIGFIVAYIINIILTCYYLLRTIELASLPQQELSERSYPEKRQ